MGVSLNGIGHITLEAIRSLFCPNPYYLSIGMAGSNKHELGATPHTLLSPVRQRPLTLNPTLEISAPHSSSLTWYRSISLGMRLPSKPSTDSL